ncbi:2-carboxy-1,4-naphthoquinone phytyltransferase [Citrus sinensis]|uniref:2-carboxy-1,4-naphthoquinone phytyltransferase n=1 Tax=Citrus sinensis TaxID=2711 RepID=A0ACB8IKR9_CITSI|nr:2-carboxy-1,4-naphthoquinone phytyltransferase [Citrus sinensis]
MGVSMAYVRSFAGIVFQVGSAAAYLQTGMFSARRYFVLLISSVLIITWLNLSNDVYDFDTGADKNKTESVVNLVGSRTGTLVAAYLLLVLGFVGLTWASVEAGNLRAIMLLTCAVICGYIYQCPPFRLSYQGLGEPLCFAAFGPFATTAFYLLLGSTRLPILITNNFMVFHFPCHNIDSDGFDRENLCLSITATVLSASLLVGLTTSLILFCSHFHQVRLGTERGSVVVKWAVMTLYSLLFAIGLSRALPLSCIFLCAMTSPIGKLVVSYVEENHKDKGKIFMAKYYCVRLHALFGAALVAGLITARILVTKHIPKLVFQ